MTYRWDWRLAAAMISFMFACNAARAQELNYGALQAMFGEPVTTSATGSPLQANRAPADMTIISQDQIRQSGATDITDILRYVMGVDVRSYGANDNTVAIGGNSQPYNPRLLVLINGRQVYLDNYGYTEWQLLPVQLADIRQIEIVRGSSSALFGFNAVDGVINIITFDPLFDRTNQISFGIGTGGMWTGSLVSTLNRPGKGGITVQIGGIRANQYSLRSLETAAGPYSGGTQNGSYAIDGRYKPADNIETTLEVTQTSSDGLNFPANGLYTRALFRTSSVKAGLSADTGFGILALTGYINTEHDTYSSAVASTVSSNNQVDVLQLSDLFKLANVHAIRIGFEYRNNRESGMIMPSTLHYNVFSGNAMWNWQIMPQLAFTAAGRVDHLALYRSNPISPLSQYTLSDFQHAALTAESYNLGFVWTPTALDTLRLLTGRAVQAPSLLTYGVELSTMVAGNSVLYAGNPTVNPAVTVNYEADYDRKLLGIESTLHMAIFFDATHDIVQPAFATPLGASTIAPGTLVAYSQNVGKSQSAGTELGLQGTDPGGLRWNLSYTLTGVRNKLLYGPPTSPLGWDNATPVSAIDFGLGYSWRKWEADLAGHWQSNFQDVILNPALGYTPVTVRNYITLSGRIGYHLTPAITLALAGQQLAGAQIVETAGLEPQRRLLASITVNY